MLKDDGMSLGRSELSSPEVFRKASTSQGFGKKAQSIRGKVDKGKVHSYASPGMASGPLQTFTKCLERYRHMVHKPSIYST